LKMKQQVIKEPLDVFINRLPTKILINFAKKYKKSFDLKPHLPRKELILQILQKVPEEIILQDLYAPYGWAGDVTIHLFQIVGSKLNEISEESQLANVLKNFNFKRRLTELPEPIDITLSNHEIRIRHEFLGEPIIYQDPNTYKLQTIRPLKTAFSVIHLPAGFTELRIHERVYALNAIKLLKQYFGGEYRSISFTRDHIAQWIDWAATLRNARFKPTGPISTLYMSAKKREDLRDIDLFKELWERGERVEGIYIKFEYSPKEELGFSINAKMGKIMFRTFASEEEIKFVIDQGRKILGL
jgi:hypothetical protein